MKALAVALLLAGCTPAQQAQAAKDSRAALDKACAVRAVEKAMVGDSGAP